eukprot:2958610-Alexandrium_andersonii.AAC.1
MAILAGRVGSKPWSLRRDGDIWQRFHQAVQGRGLDTCRFAWVPGHQTRADVEAGKLTAAELHGNEASHEMANLG